MPLALIVGPGRVGTAMAVALQRGGYSVVATGGGGESRRRFRSLLGEDATIDASSEPAADLTVIAVPDGVIESVARDIAGRGAITRGQLAVHLSGAVPSSVLEPLRGLGADVLAMHPLRTISDPATAASQLQGTVFTLEGDAQALERGRDLVQSLGGIPWAVTPDQKTRIHAAAVLSSNAVLALLATALDVASDQPGDAEIALPALLSLAEGAISNASREGLAGALTGPVARSDVETVRRHLQMLGGEPREVYRAMLAPLLRLARAAGRLDPEADAKIALLAAEVNGDWPHA